MAVDASSTSSGDTVFNSTMNAEEAAKCRQLAEAALRSGDRAKASRLANKALRMNPSDAATAKLIELLSSSSPSASPNNRNGKRTPSARRRSKSSSARNNDENGSSNNNAKPSSSNEKSYTPAQKSLVDKILKSGNLYDIIGVSSQDAVDEDCLKKAYKKMALQLHPDKCNAPGAEEAFKKVSHAFQVLSDPQKRQRYEASYRSGSSSGSNIFNSGSNFNSNDHDDDRDVFTAEELFEAFFGMGTGTAFFGNDGRLYTSGMRRRRGGGGARQQQQNHYHQRAGSSSENASGNARFFAFLPLILMLGLSMLMSIFQSQISAVSKPRFAFEPTRSPRWGEAQFTLPRMSHGLGVTYYVEQQHAKDFPANTPKLFEFEKSVEDSYMVGLYNECEFEERNKSRRVNAARRRGEGESASRLQSAKIQACESLREIRKTHPKIYQRVHPGFYGT
jgi:DnaJ homolog subfamily B member 12